MAEPSKSPDGRTSLKVVVSQAVHGEREALLDAVWPPGCRLCGRPATDGLACVDHALTFLRSDREVVARCGLCSRRLPPGTRPEALVAPPWQPAGVGGRSASWRRCRACRLQAPGFGRLLALDDYPGDLRPWVLAFKHGRRDLAVPLARLLAGRMREAGWTVDVEPVLVPVPAHFLRRIERGFDAPYSLAHALGGELEWPCARLLRRTRITPPQGEPGSSSRTANVAGAFTLGWSGRLRVRTLRKRPAILVDDVGSSGATLSECARKLRAAGFKAVGAVTLARAQRAR